MSGTCRLMWSGELLRFRNVSLKIAAKFGGAARHKRLPPDFSSPPPAYPRFQATCNCVALANRRPAINSQSRPAAKRNCDSFATGRCERFCDAFATGG